MSAAYDFIVIGGGHNGLTAASWLAKVGRKVLVLEKRAILGGAAATEELIPGYRFNIGAPDAGMLLPQVLDGLDPQRHGLEFIENAAAAHDLVTGLTLWRDTEKTQTELTKFSSKDAAAWSGYLRQTELFAGVLRQMAGIAPFAIKGSSLSLLLAWARLALRLRGLGGKDMMEFLRVLPMSAYQHLNEHFESDALKGMLAAISLTGLDQGPRAAGTAFMLLYQQMGGLNGGFRSSRVVRGGVGRMSEALANAAEASGAEIRLHASVESIMTENGRIIGVKVQGEEEFRAKAVLSTVDPRTTLFAILGAPQLTPQISRRVKNLKLRGTTASVHLALSGLPNFPSANGDPQRLTGALLICPSIDYAERAHDDAKYGRISEKPILEARIPSLLDPSMAPSGKQTMSITVRFTPYRLRESDWDSQREALADLVVDALAEYSPNLKTMITDRRVITPLDYEREYGLAEGSIFHGQMGLDQLLLMRPIPGFVSYRSPIDGLYLGGAGAHPGGGVTGAPGLNAAKQVHKELR
jgi:phytoene dehydrogenase-like protein